jgi:hypothetical protein
MIIFSALLFGCGEEESVDSAPVAEPTADSAVEEVEDTSAESEESEEAEDTSAETEETEE